MPALLKVEDVTKTFGGLMAVNYVSFDVEEGQIVGLIGPNGAGKTTLFSCISGFYMATKGSIHFREKDITGLSADSISHLGIARTFQIVKPLKDMTVLDNVTVGALGHNPKVRAAREYAEGLCQFGGLGPKMYLPAQKLTIADKKRLEIVRALATKPALLMLDETMAGLNPSERLEAVELVKKINREMSITILMIEHVMDIIMPLSNKIVVLDYGKKIAEGPPQEIVRNPEVIKAYLGERYNAEAISG